MAKRQIRLGAFVPGTSQHVAGWRHPEARPQDSHNLNTSLNWQKLLNAVCLMRISLLMFR